MSPKLGGRLLSSIPFVRNQILQLVEENPNWKNLNSITINFSAYEKIKRDSSFKQEGSVWTRDEVEIAGKCYPQLSYELKQIRFDLWMVEWIEFDGTRQYFTSNPIGSSLHIAA